MDPRQNGQRPAARPAASAQQSAPGAAHVPSNGAHNSPKKTSKKSLIGLVLAGLLLIAGFAAWDKFAPTPGVDAGKFQAVFLNNDQVYFGKIRDISDDELVMTDIYYLQQSSNQQQSVGQAAESKDTDQANLSLVKLGEELHGPQDEMRINRDQIIFWENLKDNGKVAEAIKNYKK
jgi:hypothetical protein